MLQSWYNSLTVISAQSVEDFSVFIPRALGALVLFLIGVFIARMVKGVVVRLLEALRVSSLVEKTPIEHFLKNAELSHKAEEIVGSVFYWLVMLIVLQTVVAVLGLESLSNILNQILSYIPNVISAVLVLFFGVLVAGVIESLVKGSIKTIDGKSARLLGKVSSYLVIVIAMLIAISELGIASEFIFILFIGLVATVTLGLGLSLGLGAQDLVSKILNRWYQRTSKEIKN